MDILIPLLFMDKHRLASLLCDRWRSLLARQIAVRKDFDGLVGVDYILFFSWRILRNNRLHSWIAFEMVLALYAHSRASLILLSRASACTVGRWIRWSIEHYVVLFILSNDGSMLLVLEIGIR